MLVNGLKVVVGVEELASVALIVAAGVVQFKVNWFVL